MISTDTAIIAALQRPEVYAHPVKTVTPFETHVSWVLFTGDYVYKIEKPVNFGFLHIDATFLQQSQHNLLNLTRHSLSSN